MNNQTVKVSLNNNEIKYFVVNLQDGKIIETGENDEINTFEDTYVDLKTLIVNQPPKVSFNYSVYTRRFPNRKPVWTDLNYTISSITPLNG